MQEITGFFLLPAWSQYEEYDEEPAIANQQLIKFWTVSNNNKYVN